MKTFWAWLALSGISLLIAWVLLLFGVSQAWAQGFFVSQFSVWTLSAILVGSKNNVEF